MGNGRHAGLAWNRPCSWASVLCHPVRRGSRDPDHPEANKARASRGSTLSNPITRDGIDALGLYRHVSLLRGRQHSFISCSLLTVQLKQEASRAEPKSLRPLQAEEEYVVVSLASLLPSLLILLFFALQLQSVVRLLCSPPPNRIVSLTFCR